MTEKDFQDIFEATVAKCRAILCSKNTEYARGGDKLSNFKKAGAAQGIQPETALRGMWVKHTVSVCDYIQDLENGYPHSADAWEEKILDTINYMLLLQALLTERETSRFGQGLAHK